MAVGGVAIVAVLVAVLTGHVSTRAVGTFRAGGASIAAELVARSATGALPVGGLTYIAGGIAV